MGALIEVDGDLLLLDLDPGRDVEEISEDLFGFRVRKLRGARLICRTSSMAAASGLRVAGRSSSRRRGSRAKPSSRSRIDNALMLMEWPAAANSRWIS